MLFPVSGIEVNPLVPFGVAFGISFFTSMGGVSGAFLLLPFQMSVLGYTSPSVSATNQVFNIVAIPSGVYRYIREGRMLWPLTWAVIIGTLPGVIGGAWVRIRYLPDPEKFKFFAGLVLFYIGFRLFLDVVRNQRRKISQPTTQNKSKRHSMRLIEASFRKVSFEYGGEAHAFSPVMVYVICFFVGIVGGIYGIGGGAIVAPFFVTIIRLPVYVVAGAALMGTFVTSVMGVAVYQLFALIYTEAVVAPDWVLGALFGCGGMVGMYLGARSQKYVPARIIKGILCGCVLFVSVRYLIGFF